jgi:hypothetical protein
LNYPGNIPRADSKSISENIMGQSMGTGVRRRAGFSREKSASSEYLRRGVKLFRPLNTPSLKSRDSVPPPKA